MPLRDGSLTEEELGRAFSVLEKHWKKGGHPGGPQCPSCGQNGYFLHPALFGNRSDTLIATESHTRLPTVGVYCKHCGHLTHYVARVLGIEVLRVGEG